MVVVMQKEDLAGSQEGLSRAALCDDDFAGMQLGHTSDNIGL